MRFPSPTGRLFWFLFWLAVGPLVLILPASAWLAWTLAPLQKVYLTTYPASSVGAGIPHREITVRWVMKTALKREPVAASSEDDGCGNRHLVGRFATEALRARFGWPMSVARAQGVLPFAPERALFPLEVAWRRFSQDDVLWKPASGRPLRDRSPSRPLWLADECGSCSRGPSLRAGAGQSNAWRRLRSG